MPHIYSTLSADNEYTGYVTAESGAHQIARVVRIKGGAHVAQPLNLLIGKNLTPSGHRTTVTDDELAFLESIESFNVHKKNGFIKIIHSSKAEKVEKAVKNMEAQDQSAPLTEADYDPKNKKARGAGAAPKTSKVV